MAVTIQLPEDVERKLRSATPNLDAEAKELMLVELYRQQKLTRYELSQSLELNRFETDGILQKHSVTEDLPTVEELEQDLKSAHKLLRR